MNNKGQNSPDTKDFDSVKNLLKARGLSLMITEIGNNFNYAL